MAISDATRRHTLAALSTKKKQDDTAIGKSAARRELAKAGVLEKQRLADIERVTARILPRLTAADEKTMSSGELRRAMRDVPKDLLDETMAVLADAG
jgi:hypothetical protein